MPETNNIGANYYSRMAEKTKTVLIVLIAAIAGYFAFLHYSDKGKGEHAETVAVSIYNQVGNTSKLVKALSDTIKQKSPAFYRGKMTTNKPDTVYIPLKLDTAKYALKLSIAQNKKLIFFDKIADSLKLCRAQINNLSKENTLLKLSKKNYILQIAKDKGDFQHRFADSTNNADIYIFPFKKSTHQNLFSPEKNYLRVSNKVPDGKVNGLPYYDFEQTNDEINQLLFQLRSSYNFFSGKVQFGTGLELKINRISINGALFYEPIRHDFIPSIGARIDYYRVRFK